MAAYISVPRDFSKVKSKVAFNLTARQLICFGAAAVVGVPLFFVLRDTAGNSGATLGMMAVMLPIQKLKPIIRSAAAYAPPEVVDGKPPVYPYTPIKSDFEDAETVEEMMLYTELQSAVHAMIQRLEYSFTFNPSLLTSPKRKKQVAEILTEAEKYIWRIKEEMRCA